MQNLAKPTIASGLPETGERILGPAAGMQHPAVPLLTAKSCLTPERT